MAYKPQHSAGKKPRKVARVDREIDKTAKRQVKKSRKH